MRSSMWVSVFKAKCPVCHEGDVFDNKGIYDIRDMDKMHATCSNCGHKFEKELGFWYGAMFVSYALTVAASVATFVLTYLIYPEATVWVYIAAITVMAFILSPINFRASRLLWMNMFSKFNNKISKNEQI